MLTPRLIALMFSVGAVIVASDIVAAQDYPNKPIRIVTAGAGGGSDFTARIIAEGISGPLGQPVIVDNRGSSIPSGEHFAKAPPDGYTLFVQGSGVWILPLFQKAPYDTERDFAPISLLVRETNVLAVHPSVPVKSVKELITLAKAKPGQLNYASTSIGSPTHLAGELFKFMAGVNIVRVPYNGAAPAVTAVMSGEVQLTFIDVGQVAPHVKSGRLRALAVTSTQPSALVPGLPTVSASGLPGYEAIGMTGFWAPAKTSETIINRLNQESVRVVNRPDIKERFLNAGVETVGSLPEQFAITIKSDIAKTRQMIKEAGLRAD